MGTPGKEKRQQSSARSAWQCADPLPGGMKKMECGVGAMPPTP
jgi:hypothetical protein